MTPDACSLGRRAAAAAIDMTAALTPLWAALPLIIWFRASPDGSRQFAASLLIVAAIAMSALGHLLFCSIQAARGRQTLGQRVAKVRLASLTDQRACGRRVLRESAVRGAFWAACLLSGALPLLAIDAVWCVADPARRSLRDRICGTVLQRS